MGVWVQEPAADLQIAQMGSPDRVLDNDREAFPKKLFFGEFFLSLNFGDVAARFTLLVGVSQTASW